MATVISLAHAYHFKRGQLVKIGSQTLKVKQVDHGVGLLLRRAYWFDKVFDDLKTKLWGFLCKVPRR